MSLFRIFLVGIATMACFTANAQSGCTDPLATNYDPNATINDGSCIYPPTYDTPALRAQLPTTLHESSGIIWTDGKLWTHNDSGNPNAIYSIDTTTGSILQTIYIDNFTNTDWEDITADSNYIYVSDCGNNNGDRQDLKVLKIAKSDITDSVIVHVNAQAINLSYTDQTSYTPSSSNNFDCESILSIGDTLYLFSKDRGDYSTRVYKLPKTPGTYAISPYTSYYVNGLITGADYNPQTKEVALIGYNLIKFNSFVWLLSDYKVDSFFSGNKHRIQIENHFPWQTEGIAWIGNRLFITNETDVQPASLYIMDNIWYFPLALKNITGTSGYSVYPNPFQNFIAVDNISGDYTYKIISVTGRVILSGRLTPSMHNINTSCLIKGTYFLVLTDSHSIENTTTIAKQ